MGFISDLISKRYAAGLKAKAKIPNLYLRMVDTKRFHLDKTGKPICRIYTLKEKPTNYSPELLAEIRFRQTRAALKANGFEGVLNVSRMN